MIQQRVSRDGGHGRTASSILALAAAIAGPLAALPAGDLGQVPVMFRPGLEGAPAFNALAAADARVLWVDRSGGLWAVSMAEPQRTRELYRRGALLVSNSYLIPGCFAWSRPAT
jgi:hypothetical protein